MSLVRAFTCRTGNAVQPVFRPRTCQARQLNKRATGIEIGRRMPRGRKAGIYAVSTVLASLGWLAWDASEYAKVASNCGGPPQHGQKPVAKHSIPPGRAFAYLSTPSLSGSEETSVLAPLTSRLTALALSHQFGTGETLEEVFKLAATLNEKRIGAIVTFADPQRRPQAKPEGDGEDADAEAAIEEAAVKAATAYKDEIFRAVDLACEIEERSGPLNGRIGILFKVSGLLPDPEVLLRRAERLSVECQASSEPRRLIVQEGDWEKLWSIDQSNGWQNIRDVFVLDDAYEAVREIVNKARPMGLDVFIDNERESKDGKRDHEYEGQSAVEVLVDKLMSEFNKPEQGPPVVHVGMKSKSKLDAEKVESQIRRAGEAGYSLGLKLEQEDDSAEEIYKAIAGQVLKAMKAQSKSNSGASVEIKPVFMTHDGGSVTSIQDHLTQMSHSDHAVGQLALGQVYGRRDDLASAISRTTDGDSMLNVSKILLRGPYEQTAGHGTYKVERGRIASEILRRSMLR